MKKTVKRKKSNQQEEWFFWIIRDGLRRSGNSPFLEFLDEGNYNLKFTDDIETVAYVQSGYNTIFINKYFYLQYLKNMKYNENDIYSADMKAIRPVLMLVKHEILHKALWHEQQTLLIIAKQLHLDYRTLDDFTLEKLRTLAYAPSALLGSLQNITGDYHIGRHYTAMDKLYVRNLDFYGEKVEGLLNELNDPDAPYPGVDFNSMSFEELYKFFQKENRKAMLASGNYEIEYVDNDTWQNL